jgi:hypothetical protein
MGVLGGEGHCSGVVSQLLGGGSDVVSPALDCGEGPPARPGCVPAKLCRQAAHTAAALFIAHCLPRQVKGSQQRPAALL